MPRAVFLAKSRQVNASRGGLKRSYPFCRRPPIGVVEVIAMNDDTGRAASIQATDLRIDSLALANVTRCR